MLEIFLSRDHPSAWSTSVAQLEPSWTLETDSHIHYMTPTAIWSYRTSVLSPHPLGMLLTCTLWKTVDSIRPYRGRGHRVYVGIRLPLNACPHTARECTWLRTAMRIPGKADTVDKGKGMYSGLHWKFAMTPHKVQSFCFFCLKRLACMMELLRSTTCETGMTCLLLTASKFLILH